MRRLLALTALATFSAIVLLVPAGADATPEAHKAARPSSTCTATRALVRAARGAGLDPTTAQARGLVGEGCRRRPRCSRLRNQLDAIMATWPHQAPDAEAALRSRSEGFLRRRCASA